MAFGRVRLILAGLGVLGASIVGTPDVVLADHCGAVGLVVPSSGAAGTVFVIEPQLGSPTDLGLYRNGRLVAKIYLDDGGAHAFVAQPGDEGRWEARAWLRSQPECRSVMAFAVTPLPDTAAADPSSPATLHWPVALTSLAGAAALAWVLRRRAVRP